MFITSYTEKKESGIILLFQNSSFQLSLNWKVPAVGTPQTLRGQPALVSALLVLVAWHTGRADCSDPGHRNSAFFFPFRHRDVLFYYCVRKHGIFLKKLFQTGHSLPQHWGCRWDLLCCRERAGASWEPSFYPTDPLLSHKVLLPRWQLSLSAQVPIAEGWQSVLWLLGTHRLLSSTLLSHAVLLPPPSHLRGSNLCSAPTKQNSLPSRGSTNVFLIKTSISRGHFTPVQREPVSSYKETEPVGVEEGITDDLVPDKSQLY